MNDILFLSFVLGLLQLIRLSSGLLSLRQTGCSTEVDVVFALDGSDTVLPSEFIQQKAFLTSQTVLYDISPSKIQIGAFAYGQGTSNISGLNPFRDGKELISFISSLTPPTGVSSLSLALNLVWDILSSEGRENANKLGFIFTSGPMSNTTSTAAFAQVMRNSNISIVLVGVGPEPNETDMETITGNKSHVIKVDTFDSLFSIAHSVKSLICIESSYAAKETKLENAEKRNSRLSVWNIHDKLQLDPRAKKGLAHVEQQNSIVLQDRVVNASIFDNATFEKSDNSSEENDMFFATDNNTYAISFEVMGNGTDNDSVLYSPLQIQNETLEVQISAVLVSNLSAGMYNLSSNSETPESQPSNISYSSSDRFNATDDSQEEAMSSDISSRETAKDSSSITPTMETGHIQDPSSNNVSNDFATLGSVISAFLFDTSSNLLNSTEKVEHQSDVKYEPSITNRSATEFMTPNSYEPSITNRSATEFVTPNSYEPSITNRSATEFMTPNSVIKEYDSKLKMQFFDASFDLLKTMHLPDRTNERNKTQTQTPEETMSASKVSDTDSKEVISDASFDPLKSSIKSGHPAVNNHSHDVSIRNNEPSETDNVPSDGKGVDSVLKMQSFDTKSSLLKAASIQSEESKLGDATEMENPLQQKKDHAVYDSTLKKKLFEAPFELLQTNIRLGKHNTDRRNVSDKATITNLVNPKVETHDSHAKKTFFDAPFDLLKTEITKPSLPSLSEHLDNPLSFKLDSNVDKKADESILKKRLFDSPFDLLKTIPSNKTDMKALKSSKEKTLFDSAEQDRPILQTAYTFDFSNKGPEKESQSKLPSKPISSQIVPDTIMGSDPPFNLKPFSSPDTIKMIDANKDKENTKTEITLLDNDEAITTKESNDNMKHISLESSLEKSFFDSGFDFLKTAIGVKMDNVKPNVTNGSTETLGDKKQQIKSSVHDSKTKKKFFDSSFDLLKTIVPRKETDGIINSISVAIDNISNSTKLKPSIVDLSLVPPTEASKTSLGTKDTEKYDLKETLDQTIAKNHLFDSDFSFPNTVVKKVEPSPIENSEEATTTDTNRTSDEQLTKEAEQMNNLSSKPPDAILLHPKYTSTDIFKEKTRPNPVKPTDIKVEGESKTTIYEANLEKKFFDSSIHLLSTIVKAKLPNSLLSSKSGKADVAIAVSEPFMEPSIAFPDNEQKHKTIPPEIVIALQNKTELKAEVTLAKEKLEIGSLLKRKFFDTSSLSKLDVSDKQLRPSLLQINAKGLSKDLTKAQSARIIPVNSSHDDDETDASQSKIITDPKTDAFSRVKGVTESEPVLFDQFFHFTEPVPKQSQSVETPPDFAENTPDIAPPPIIPGKMFLPPPPSPPPIDVTESFGMQHLKTSEAHSFRTYTFPVVGAGKKDTKQDARISDSADTDTFAGDFLHVIAQTSTMLPMKYTGQISTTQAMTTEDTSSTREHKSSKLQVKSFDSNVNAELQQINEISSQARSSRAYPIGLEEQALKELRKLQLKRALMSRVTALTDRKLLPPQQMAQLKDKLIAVMKAKAMKSRNIPEDICQESPLETDPSFYKQRIGNETVVRPCPLGTLFNATACGCTISHVAETFAPCNAELLMEFEQDYEDHSGMASAVGARDVSIDRGSAHFTGSSQLTIWRFSGTHIGNQLDIKVRVKPMPSQFKTQHLIGNCDMDLPMTFGMELDTEREVMLFFIQTEIRGKAVLELKYNPITWNDARLRYDGLEFSAIVNSDKKSMPLGGNVVNRHVPLVIGACDDKTGGFTGHIDKLSIYFCIRGENGS